MKRWVGAFVHGPDWRLLTVRKANSHEQARVATYAALGSEARRCAPHSTLGIWGTSGADRSDVEPCHRHQGWPTQINTMKTIGINKIPAALELTKAQELELDCRLDAYRKNPSAGSPWPEVRARILNRWSTHK